MVAPTSGQPSHGLAMYVVAARMSNYLFFYIEFYNTNQLMKNETNYNLERVVSIESSESPQCSTNVIGAFQGYTL